MMRGSGAASISAAQMWMAAEIGRRIGEIVMREFPNSPGKTTQLGGRP